MTPEQFAYWLQGYTELTAGQQPTPEQWKSITEHLKTVFVKVTPEVKFQINPILPSAPVVDRLREYMDKHTKLWPNGGAPVITC
ncbi:hypothetical protein [Pseudomonas moorei]|uniref:Uncharacterized protein n=1 Tax=Pseudomonas moorei TaxID=395599 RepID=A0A1H1FJ09_9PSED|nr:hypothetical protein [Pseudomonas moorei]KAB0509667.1 hypothetical protein F7R06_01200 [Pseudomonas moorei]SDR00915.1 hypothetical protein SAMN04490195_2731 [Pseudomonas moorei]